MATSDLSLRDSPALSVRIETTQPLELVDFTGSLLALGKAYEGFVYARGYDPQSRNVKLYVRELRNGSIIADLVALAQQASFVLDHIETYSGFVTHLDELTRFFRGGTRPAAGEPTKVEAQQLNQVIEPVAKDAGAQIFLNVGDHSDVDIHLHLNSEQANATQNGIRRYLGASPPITGVHHDQVLYLAQVRGDPKAKAGDFGVIERFSEKPVKLRFSSEEVKASVLDAAHPFDVAFVVDCEVSTVGEKPALYKVYTVKDVFDRPN